MALLSRTERSAIIYVLAGTLALFCLAADLAYAGGRRGGRGRGERRRPPVAAPRSDFERAYIKWNNPYKRALLATRQANPTAAKRTLARARISWYELVYRYWEEPPVQFVGDENWHRDLATITGHLHIAESLALAGKMYAAHEALEPIRRLWLDMRERNEIPWFGDQLTRYHDVMEPVVAWGTGETGRYVTPENVGEFERAYSEVESAWQELMRAPTPPGNTRQFTMLMQQEGKAIADLRQAIETRNWGVIPEVCEELREAFVALFTGFG
ncbi:MAG: hypothetical protein JXA57_02560 [Armatimonadetes bacterium]|nr:hypothetical protein [Armatimonadota bacterium]